MTDVHFIIVVEVDGEPTVRLDLEEDRRVVLLIAGEPGVDKVVVVPETKIVPDERHPALQKITN